jgi:hypothetical protein
MRRLLESQSGHPATVHQRPRWSMVVTAMAQEEAGELLTGLPPPHTSGSARAFSAWTIASGAGASA